MSVDIKAYGDLFYQDYISGDFEVILTKYRKKKIVELMKKYNAKDVLEIGCGMEPIFLNYEGFDSMTVVEPAPQMYESAIRYADSDANINIYNNFIEDITDELSATGGYDFILDIGLIHEVENADTHIESIKRICNASKGNRVLITTNNSDSFHLRLAYEAGIISSTSALSEKAKEFQRHRAYNMAQMIDFLQSYDFQILENGSYFIKPFTHAQMKRMLDEKTITDEILDGLDAMVKYMPDMGAEIYALVTTA